jgi:cytochrome c biogenesis factor
LGGNVMLRIIHQISLLWNTLIVLIGFITLYEILHKWTKLAPKTKWWAVWYLFIGILFLFTNYLFLFINSSLLETLGTELLYYFTPVPFIMVIFWMLSRINPRRYGGYLIHLSMVVMAIGILGIDVFQTQTQKTLAVGQQMQISGYTLRYESLAQFPYMDGRQVTRAVLSVFKDGKPLGELYPRYDLYPDGQPMTIPAIRSTMAGDLYVVLVNWENVSVEQTPFKVYHNPLVSWLWTGAFLFVFGILVATWPVKNEMGNKKV